MLNIHRHFAAVARKNVASAEIFFKALTYNGTGSSNAISGAGLLPDSVWIKGRSGATDHALYDDIRGVQARLEPNNADAEVTTDAGLTSFDPDGFTVNTLAQVNTNTSTYFGWLFKESSGFFDIVTYAGDAVDGRNIAHSLGTSPEFMMVKDRTQNNIGVAWHKDMTSNAYHIYPSLTNAETNSADMWDNTTPDATNFRISSEAAVNSTAASNQYIAYLFSSSSGVCKVGSYTGDTTTEPSITGLGATGNGVMIKRTDSTGNWVMIDSARGDNYVYANSNATEGSANYIDFTSDGFDIATGVTNADVNANGGNYIYILFA